MISFYSPQLKIEDYNILLINLDLKGQINFQTAELAKKVFADIQNEKVSEGLSLSQLQELAEKIRAKAIQVSGWSHFVKCFSALYNLFTQFESVSSAHKLIREIPKSEMIKLIEQLENSAKNLSLKNRSIIDQCPDNVRAVKGWKSEEYAKSISAEGQAQVQKLLKELKKDLKEIRAQISSICTDMMQWANAQKANNIDVNTANVFQEKLKSLNFWMESIEWKRFSLFGNLSDY